MRYQLFARYGDQQVLVNEGDNLAELSTQAESYHAKNTCSKTWVYDRVRQRFAEDHVGSKSFECVWTKAA